MNAIQQMREPFVQVKLGDVCSFKQGYQFGLDEQLLHPKEGYARFLRIENYTQNSTDFRYVKVDDPDKIIDEKDVVIVRYGASAGYVGRGFSGVLANNMFRVIPGENVDREFLYYLLTDRRVFDYFQKSMIGGAMPALSFQIVGNLKVQLPPLPEQKKIASILATWDEAIAYKEKLIERKIERKQGLMQKLLSGQVRFPGFYGEWKSVPIEKICTLSIGKTPSRNRKEYWGTGYKWIAIADMKEKYISQTEEEITEQAVKETGIKRIPKNTVIMSFKLTLGRLAITAEDMYSNEAIVSFFNNNPDELDNEYLYYYLSHIDITKYGSRAAKGITLNRDSLKEIIVKLPELAEQIKIREVLTLADKEIDLLKQELALLKQQKQGLMQQLLSGKVRV